jgi:AbrB family looped-hinge helix DNA binding protein
MDPAATTMEATRTDRTEASYFLHERDARSGEVATKVSARGKVVIPPELRKKYGLTPGRMVAFVDNGRTLGIVPLDDDPVAALRGWFARAGAPSLSDMLREERRLERERHERWAD